MGDQMAVLSIQGLQVAIQGVPILRDITLEVDYGQTLGVVGESGCGKSMTGLSIMGMLPPGSRTQGRILLEGQDLLQLAQRDWLGIRGQEVAMVMQDPFTSLNPMMKIGNQISEVYRLHQKLDKKSAWAKSVEMLKHVGVPSPEQSAHKYPHQMSGGQRQRVVIAIAFASQPKLLIADEPTTALDVTLQAQILNLLTDLQREYNTAVILISHDIGVVGSVSDRVAVFYGGKVVEEGAVRDVIHEPRHPYTQALMDAMPKVGQAKLRVIGGQPPRLSELPVGCSFAPRCPHAFDACRQDPGLVSTPDGHKAACWLVADKALVE
jgi:oligopeptide transport system ATP-binding protein